MGRQVVFVDDEKEVLDALRRSLRRVDPSWEILFYDSAEAVLSRLDRERACVVVSDWMMPGMTGLDLCARLREAERRDGTKRFYVILMTGQQQSEAVVQALDHGADDFVRKPFDQAELAARVRVGFRMLEAEEALRLANRELRQLCVTDELTQLVNRRRANEILHNELARAGRGVQSLSAFMIDVDHFKQLNDRHGHNAGDAALQVVAERIRSGCRAYDSVARWGGEEFLVICPGAGEAEIERIGERIRQSLAMNPVSVGPGELVHVTASVGGAYTSCESALGAADFVRRADEALYRAKNAGRDCVRIQRPPVAERALSSASEEDAEVR